MQLIRSSILDENLVNDGSTVYPTCLQTLQKVDSPLSSVFSRRRLLPLGLAVGESDGRVVGDLDGALDGTEVGAIERRSVGANDGGAVFAIVGALDGARLTKLMGEDVADDALSAVLTDDAATPIIIASIPMKTKSRHMVRFPEGALGFA